MKSISFMKFDYDACKKVDDIFTKYGIVFNYTNFIKKLEKKYVDRQKDFFDDYSDDEAIGYKHFNAEFKKKYKPLNIDLDEEFITIDSGFIYKIYVPEPISSISDLDDIEWDSKDINTLQDLEDGLKLLIKRLDSHLKFKTSDQYIGYRKEYKKLMDERNAKEKEWDDYTDKLRRQLSKIAELEGEFDD